MTRDTMLSIILVSLRGEKISGYAHKTGSPYLLALGFLFSKF